MIPIHDNIPSRSKPIVNYVLIGINIALFLAELKLELSGELGDFLQRWGVMPERVVSVAADVATNAIALRNPAAWVALLVMNPASLLLGMFLHGSFSQILANMLFLGVFGRKVEDILGHTRFLGFYLLCGFVSAVAQVMLDPKQGVPLVGANGAIAGVLGAYLVSFPKAKIETILPLVILFIPIELPAFFYLLWWFVQQIFYSIGQLTVEGGVNPVSLGYWAHGVGVVIGAALAPLMVKRKPTTAIY